MEMLRWRKERVGAPLESVQFWRCGGVKNGLGEVGVMLREGLVGGIAVFEVNGKYC